MSSRQERPEDRCESGICCHGIANIGAGLLTGFPAATMSASRTTVNDQMGGKSQWVGLIAAGLTIIFLLFLHPLLAPLPTVALGAIIIVASIGLFDMRGVSLLEARCGAPSSGSRS